MASRFRFNEMLKSMSALKRDLPPVIGNMGLRFFVDTFSKQGWTDNGFHPWEPKKDKKNNLPILVGKSGGTKSGAHTHLRKAVNNSLVKTTWNEILYDVKGVPYARIHNEGGIIHKNARKGKVSFRDFSTNLETGVITRRFAGNKGRKYLRATSSLDVNFKAHQAFMPKRQYIGYSATLMNQIKNKINSEMLRVLKSR